MSSCSLYCQQQTNFFFFKLRVDCLADELEGSVGDGGGGIIKSYNLDTVTRAQVSPVMDVSAE